MRVDDSTSCVFLKSRRETSRGIVIIYRPLSHSSKLLEMASTISIESPSTSKLELRTAYGPVFRDVLHTPPRDCTSEEIPIIDLAPLYSSNVEDRKEIASEIRAAAVNTGFFYIKNHGIADETIANAKKQLLTQEPLGLLQLMTSG